MSLIEFLILLIIAGVCGAIALAIVGFSRGGCLVSIGAGLIGAVLGHWLAARLGLPSLLVITVDGRPIDIVWTLIGAILLLAIASLVTRGRRV